MNFSGFHLKQRPAEKNNSSADIRHCPRQSAFTLIEIMVSIVIFSMVIAAICATLMLLIRATTVGQNAAARAQRQRVVMSSIENSLMTIQSFQASPQYYSFIVENGTEPVLSFTARLPGVFPRGGKFVNAEEGKDYNLRRLTFTVEPGENRKNNLVLRQKPILMDLDPIEQKEPLILAQDVKTFAVECWDTNQMEWVTDWENTNSIPPLVRVELVLGSDNPNENNQEADSQRDIVRVYSLPTTMMPRAVQTGGAGGIGGFGQPPPILPPVQPRR